MPLSVLSEARCARAAYRDGGPLMDQEEADIQRQIASDPDAPEVTDAQAAQARPFAEALPDLRASVLRSRGRLRVEHPKEAVTLRLDSETVAKFNAAGDDWRARMGEALKRAERKLRVSGVRPDRRLRGVGRPYGDASLLRDLAAGK